ncbi:C-C chemokine receptor type 6 [Rhinophrynus dorsalis]
MEYFTTTPDYDDYQDGMCSMEEVRVFKKKCAPVVFSLIFIVGLIGNILVVITFRCYKRSKSMTDVYLLNMAIADILFVLTLPFWAWYYHENKWIFRDFMCKLVRSIYTINFNCSMLLLACVGIDRYVAIVQVTKSFRFRTTTMAYKGVICFFVWIMSACLSSITYIFSKCYKTHNDELVCEASYPSTSTAMLWKLAVIIVQFSLGFFIPFLVMVFCYSFIIKTLLQAQNSQRHKAIRVIVAVVAVFLICQVPYNVLLLKKAAALVNKDADCSADIRYEYAFFISETLAFFHCCLNPVIYAFVGVKFRNYFMKIIQDLWCISKQYMTRQRGSRISSDNYTSRRTSEVFATEGGSSFTM